MAGVRKWSMLQKILSKDLVYSSYRISLLVYLHTQILNNRVVLYLQIC